MPIEIRELVVKMTVTKSLDRKEKEYITQKDLRRIKSQIVEDCLDRVKDLIEEERSAR